MTKPVTESDLMASAQVDVLEALLIIQRNRLPHNEFGIAECGRHLRDSGRFNAAIEQRAHGWYALATVTKAFRANATLQKIAAKGKAGAQPG